ncbi:MAG: hypothetical protein Q9M13_03395 [Mariprofundales bacterium]|nr:hypothetical protein [Mariprofundales bacterium]
MGFFGSNPVAEGQAIAQAASGLTDTINQWYDKRLLKRGLEAAKALMFDPSFSPSSVSEVGRYAGSHGEAMRTILELPPEIQQQVWTAVGMWKQVMGQPVPGAVRQILAQLGTVDPTASTAKQRTLGGLLQLISASPQWAAQNKGLLEQLLKAGKELGPEYMQLSPGAGIFNQATGQVEAILDDPNRRFRTVQGGLYDIQTGGWTVPPKQPETEEWETLTDAQGNIFIRNKKTGEMKRVHSNKPDLISQLLAAQLGLPLAGLPGSNAAGQQPMMPQGQQAEPQPKQQKKPTAAKMGLDPKVFSAYKYYRNQGLSPQEAMAKALDEIEIGAGIPLQ